VDNDGGTDVRVPRERLVRALLDNRLGVIEAGAGYGKSVLASQYRQALGVATVYVPLGPPDGEPAVLTSSLRRAIQAARLSDLTSSTDVADPGPWIDRLLDALVATEAAVLLILDDAHHLRGSEVADLVVRLARGLPAPHRMLVTARSLNPSMEPVRVVEGTSSLSTSDLAFTSQEAAELMSYRLGYRPTEYDVKVLIEATRGWATALVLATAARGGAGRRPDSATRPGPTPQSSQQPAVSDVIAAPLRRILDGLAPSERTGLFQLAQLPFFSPELCDAVTGVAGAFDRIVAEGIPLARAGTGWWELPGPVTAFLAAQALVTAATVRAAADVYTRHGDVPAAIRVLMAADLAGEAAGVLAGMPPDRVDDLGLAFIRDLVEALPEPAIRQHPSVLLHLARVAETAHQGDLRRDTLAHARRLLHDGGREGDPVVLHQIDAERARDLVWDERTRQEARVLATAVIDQTGADELVARARALDVLGRLACWFSAEGPQATAEPLLEESARLARRVGQRTWAAQALVALAMGYCFALSRFERALAILDEVLADLPARNRYRALVLSFRADVLIETGRFSEAQSTVENIREIGLACREEWILAFASWNEAELASYMGDRARTLRAVLEAEQHHDAWYEEASGVEFLVMVANALDRSGEHRLALRYMRRAEERVAGNEHVVKVNRAALLGRSGDPLAAEVAIRAVLTGPDLEPQERWPLLVLRAYAALRANAPEAGQLAADAFESCLQLGHPQGPLVRESAVARKLLPLAVAAGSRAAGALVDQAGALGLRLLGGFEISRDGNVVELPPGRPSKAVRAVAAAGGRLHGEELVELLWPEIDPLRGRNRLRNLLSRLRLAAGDVLVRDGDMIALPPGSELDSVSFEHHARAARTARASGDTRRAVAAGRSALERYRGELLPDDRHEAWGAAARERLAAWHLEVLDLLASEAESSSEVDEAVRLLQRGIDAEPYDEQRYLHLARLLASQGRAGSALGVLRRARAALDELDLDVSAPLEDLERALGGSRRV
jgi:ATP/maltotriose-dependent transcriptional regulator MalT/DNA-binding SARP family transcriptional activator